MSEKKGEEILEDYIIEKLTEEKADGLNWTFVKAGDLDRDSFEDPLLVKNLIRKIQELNDVKLEQEDIQEVLKKLQFRPNTLDGIKTIMNFLKEGVSIRLEKQKSLERIKLFDYDHPEKNEFIVSRQVHYANGDTRIITDVMLYVNGIPLVNIEVKNPASFSEDWTNAFSDVKKYEQDIPELYKYVQIGVAAAETMRYFPSVRWQPDNVRTEQWKQKGIDDPIDAGLLMFDPATLMDIIRNFMFYRIEFGNATKVITRYMQYRAVNKIVDRVINNTEGKTDKKKGLIWHWQGSGKTLEMIFAANKLYNSGLMNNPSVFFIVDRQELEEQLRDEFNALDITKPEIIESINALRNVIKHDDYKGKRGLMVAMVHKFRPEELEQVEKEMRSLSEKQETLLTRKNVITFVDEGHRTQSGQLAAQMKRILGEDTTHRFAFTGTPICKPNKGVDTYEEFSYKEDERYLDGYFIDDSIRDGFTVKISYQPALEDVEGIHLDREKLDAFLEQEYDEIPDSIKEDVKEGVRKKLNVVKVYLENPERIKQVAEHIAKHYQEHLDGKFKAMVVCVSREACVMYKRELDKLLPPEYSEVVMSYDDKKDVNRKGIPEFKKEILARYKGKDPIDIKKDVVTKFKENEGPKILIVKDMLLTGFDAPVLQTMYLDQPLKEHRLLQAIARTNRPYKGVKEAGVIIDYIGILDEFERAFETYSSEEMQGVLYSPEDMKKDFLDTLKKIQDMFGELDKTKLDRKTLLKAIELLSSDEKISKEFILEYRKLRRLFELLGANVIIAEMAKEYGWISQVYAAYIKAVYSKTGEEELYVKKYFQKTVDYIHQSTELKDLIDTFPTIQFDEKYIEKLNEKLEDKEAKAANMVFTLNKFVLVDKMLGAVDETITEAAERILTLWKSKTKDIGKIYDMSLEVFNKINDLKSRQRELGLNDLSYQMLLRLEKKFGKKASLVEDAKELYKQLDQVIFIEEKKFPNWATQISVKKDVEKIIRKFIRKYVREEGINLDEMDELFKKLMDDVVNNA